MIPALHSEFGKQDKAQTRKLIYALLGTSLVVWILAILNRFHPNPSIRGIMLAALLPCGYLFFRLVQQSRKIKSILPPDMESKRIAIGKAHNQSLLRLMSAVLAVWIVVVVSAIHQLVIICIAVCATGLTLGWGIRRVIQRDNALCQDLGYLCPLCHKPLYEPHAATYLTGLCPNCKENILPERSQMRS